MNWPFSITKMVAINQPGWGSSHRDRRDGSTHWEISHQISYHWSLPRFLFRVSFHINFQISFMDFLGRRMWVVSLLKNMVMKHLCEAKSERSPAPGTSDFSESSGGFLVDRWWVGFSVNRKRIPSSTESPQDSQRTCLVRYTCIHTVVNI